MVGGLEGGGQKTKLVANFKSKPKKGYKNSIQIREQEHRSNFEADFKTRTDFKTRRRDPKK